MHLQNISLSLIPTKPLLFKHIIIHFSKFSLKYANSSGMTQCTGFNSLIFNLSWKPGIYTEFWKSKCATNAFKILPPIKSSINKLICF